MGGLCSDSFLFVLVVDPSFSSACASNSEISE